MIKNPEDNRKLQIFHLIVTCCFYVDFFVTGFIISNYEFLNIQTKSDKFIDLKAFLDDPNSLYSENKVKLNMKINDFMDHETIYFYIIAI